METEDGSFLKEAFIKPMHTLGLQRYFGRLEHANVSDLTEQSRPESGRPGLMAQVYCRADWP